MAEAGIAADLVLIREDGLSANNAREVVSGMLRASNPPTGIICVNESSALGVMAGIRDCGKQVGVDCDVVTRASTAMSDYLNPPLATCHLDIQQVAQVFCDYLLRSIAGEPASALQTVFDCQFRVPAAIAAPVAP